MNKLDETTYDQILKWYDKCIQKYGMILLSLYKDDIKYENYYNNINKLHNLLNNYINNVTLLQQYNDLNIILTKINLLLINVKQMKNNLVKIDLIGGKKISPKMSSTKNKRKKSRIILSPKRMYSTIASGWI